MSRCIPDLINYLNSQVNVDDNPRNNFDLYKEWICSEKKICKVLDEDFSKEEYIQEYIQHMKAIGWNQDPVMPETISLEELNKQINEVIDNFGDTESILYRISEIEGRDTVAHRTIRDWVSFISTVIFGEDYDPIKIRYKNFFYKSGKNQILRWASLYYLHIKGSEENGEI